MFYMGGLISRHVNTQSILGNFWGPYGGPMGFSPEMVFSLKTSFKKWSGERLFSQGPMAKSAIPMQDSPYGRSQTHRFLYILIAHMRQGCQFLQCDSQKPIVFCIAQHFNCDRGIRFCNAIAKNQWLFAYFALPCWLPKARYPAKAENMLQT